MDTNPPFDVAAMLAQAGADYQPAASRNGDALDPVTPKLALQILTSLAITIARNAEAQGAKNGREAVRRTAPQIFPLTMHKSGKALVPEFLRDIDPRGPLTAHETPAATLAQSKALTALINANDDKGAIQMIASELARDGIDAVAVILPTVTFTGAGDTRAEADKAATKKRKGAKIPPGTKTVGKIPKGGEATLTIALYTPWHDVIGLMEGASMDFSDKETGKVGLQISGMGGAIITPPYSAQAVQAAYWSLYNAPADASQA